MPLCHIKELLIPKRISGTKMFETCNNWIILRNFASELVKLYGDYSIRTLLQTIEKNDYD